MKDVYEKNPQMGDPSSLQPKISETICNMEKLRSEIHKNEVWKGISLEFRKKQCVPLKKEVQNEVRGKGWKSFTFLSSSN